MDQRGNNCSYSDNPVNSINGREGGGAGKDGEKSGKEEEMKKRDNSEGKKCE